MCKCKGRRVCEDEYIGSLAPQSGKARARARDGMSSEIPRQEIGVKLKEPLGGRNSGARAMERQVGPNEGGVCIVSWCYLAIVA
jgi:hypothetical protein